MVRLLNSPNFQTLPGGANISPIPGYQPGIDWGNMMSQMIQLLATKAIENKGKMSELNKGAREQAVNTTNKLIAEGATPAEAWAYASQSMPSYKKTDDKPWLTNENWGIPLPNLQNIWGNIQNRVNLPAPTYASKISTPQLRSQKTLAGLGIKMPKNLSWLSGLTPKEVDQMDQIVKMSMMASGFKRTGWDGGGGKELPINPTIWAKAKELVESELESDLNFTLMKVEDPGLAGLVMDSRIRDKYDQFMAATIGKPGNPAAPAAAPGIPGKKATVGDFLKGKAKGGS